jgi:adenylate cyclase
MAGDLEGVHLNERGRQSFKNVSEPLALYPATWRSQRTASGLAIDPVCRMAVDPGNSAGTLTHQGVEYHFCSLDCAGTFATYPQRYVEQGDDAK